MAPVWPYIPSKGTLNWVLGPFDQEESPAPARTPDFLRGLVGSSQELGGAGSVSIPVSVLQIVIMVSSIYFIFGYLDP